MQASAPKGDEKAKCKAASSLPSKESRKQKSKKEALPGRGAACDVCGFRNASHTPLPYIKIHPRAQQHKQDIPACGKQCLFCLQRCLLLLPPKPRRFHHHTIKRTKARKRHRHFSRATQTSHGERITTILWWRSGCALLFRFPTRRLDAYCRKPPPRIINHQPTYTYTGRRPSSRSSTCQPSSPGSCSGCSIARKAYPSETHCYPMRLPPLLCSPPHPRLPLPTAALHPIMQTHWAPAPSEAAF